MPNVISTDIKDNKTVIRYDDNTLYIKMNSGGFKWMKGISNEGKTKWVLHREGGEPAVNQIEKNKVETGWFINGKEHREGDLPAKIIIHRAEIYKYGPRITKTMAYYTYGMLNRDGDFPAHIVTVTQPTGNTSREIKSKETWIKNGLTHRDNDKPALIKKEDDIITVSEWYVKGKLHRANGLPAKIKKDIIEFYENGNLHNLTHSARIDNRKEPLNGRLYYVELVKADYGTRDINICVNPVFSIFGRRMNEGHFIEFQNWLTDNGIDATNITTEDRILIDMKWNFNGR